MINFTAPNTEKNKSLIFDACMHLFPAFYFRVKNNAFVWLLIVLPMVLLSCEQQVNINLKASAPQVVVQGAIETNLPPYVILTNTVGFFSSIDLATLQNNFIHNAVVTVNDGTNTVTLKEYALDTGKGNKFYIYSVDTSNPSQIMIGAINKFYTLNIIYQGVTYTGVTKIPAPKGLDSLWFAAPLFTDRKTPDSAHQLYMNYTDPDTPGNNICYYTQINNQVMYLAGVYNDAVINGKTVSNIALVAGYNNTDSANVDSLRYFYPGDTVTVKWCEIDNSVYNFWNNYFYAIQTLGNPFAAPTNVIGNLNNGALGIWGGYGSIYYKVVVP